MSTPGPSWVFRHPRVCVAAAAAIGLLALIVGSRFVSKQKASVPPVIVLSSTYAIPPQKAPIPDRWIPRSWGWMWRLKEAVLGKAKAINLNIAAGELDSAMLGVQAAADPELRSLLKHPDAETDGIKVWLLPNSRIRDLQNSFSGSVASAYFFRCGITTADQCHASLGTTVIGTGRRARQIQADVLPLFHGSTVDLTFVLKSVAPVAMPPAPAGLPESPPSQTNAVRVQLPGNTGFFVLNSQRESNDGIETAVLVTVEPPNNKTTGTRPAAIIKRAN